MRMIILVAALVACGKDAAPTSADRGGTATAATAPTAAGTGKKPCEYVARADAEAALELPLPGTTETEVTGECIYHTAEFYGVTVAIGTWDGVLEATKVGSGHPPIPVTGVGDEAVRVGTHLYVRKGDRGLKVDLNGPAVDGDEDKAIARAKTLALKILPKM